MSECDNTTLADGLSTIFSTFTADVLTKPNSYISIEHTNVLWAVLIPLNVQGRWVIGVALKFQTRRSSTRVAHTLQ